MVTMLCDILWHAPQTDIGLKHYVLKLNLCFRGLNKKISKIGQKDWSITKRDCFENETIKLFLLASIEWLLCDNLFPVSTFQRDALIEELNRVTAENKKLTELLTVMCENCNELRNQLLECTTKNYGADNNNNNNTVALKKRKAESSINTGGNNNTGASESSYTDEDSSKKRSEEQVKPKISRTCVRTEVSDTNLVSSIFLTTVIWMIVIFIMYRHF